MSPGLQRKPDALSKGDWTLCAEAKRPWKPRLSRGGSWAWHWLALLLTFVLVAKAAAPTSIEYRVKAVALLNFTKFTEWPAGSFATRKSPLVLGIYGEDPFGVALPEAIAGETVNGHPLEIRSVASGSSIDGCHLLFIGRSETANLKSIMKALAGKPILTISEIDGFRDSGGMIQFILHENRVRFDINRTSATEAGLVLSSRLLGVARTVTGK